MAHKISLLGAALQLLLAWQWQCSAEQQPLYKDSKQPAQLRVKDLLSRMTLEEKIGQMTQLERDNATGFVIRQYLIGSVMSAGGSFPAPRASPQAWADFVDDLQDGALQTRLGIPVVYGIDAVHGHNNVYGATIFPHNVGLGSTRDPDLARRIGEATALEVRGTGIQYAFAPCVAVCRDPRWGRCYESYSENPELVTRMTDIITGLQGQPPAGYPKGVPFVAGTSNVLACSKHYVGDGGTREGINANNTISSYNSLVNTHMLPYFDSIQKGVSTVMISYSSWNSVKMHMNKRLVTDVLKKQLGFKGFVISDSQGIDYITSPPGANYTYSVLASVNAGLDMIMVPFAYTKFIDTLTSLVKGGYIPMERIDDAVSRILYVKFIAGLFENPKSDKSLQRTVGAQSHRDLAREAVRKSLVLLKNGKGSSSTPLLPLSKTASKILVAGSHAHDLGYQCGGWTIAWQGESGNTTIGTTVLQAIQSTVSKTTQVVYEKSPDAASLKGSDYEYAIVVVGEPPYAETQGDNSNLTIPLGGIDTIKNVCGSLKCLVILISGRPLVIEPYVPLMDALVAAWLPGSEGQGITDVIFGDYDFHGKSSRTWFKNVHQLPMNFGDQVYDPLFPYGFGLTTGKGYVSASQPLPVIPVLESSLETE